MCRVYSKRKGSDPIPDGAIYVGRPTIWGNPFTVDKAGDREQHQAAVDAYRRWIHDPAQVDLKFRAWGTLAGKDLVCWCQSPSDEDPLPCHATVLLEIARR